MRALLISANREKLPSPVVPLGVLAVAGAARERHPVAVLDLCFEADPIATLRRAIDEIRPEVVGVGIRNLHTNAYDGTEKLVGEYAALVAAVRAQTGATVVLGGSGFSLQPETLLARLEADHGVVGEGELAFAGLLDTLTAGRAPGRLLYGAASSGSGLAALRRGTEGGSDLDRLPPPARDLVDPRYYEHDGTDSVQTKRGCAFSCTYCDYPDLEGRKVRVRDPERVADEVLSRASAPGVSHIFFVDSVFNVPRSRAIAVSNALTARGAPLPWVCYASPAGLDDEVAAAMARARCVGVEIGSDAGNARMLERLRKPFGIADILRTRALFLEHGIHDCHTFVLGAEGETADEARETLDFVEQLDPDLAVFIVFMEDRESMTVHRARHRDALLALLAARAPSRPGWVVPELGIRFGERVSRLMERGRVRGPSWLRLAAARRRTPGDRGRLSASLELFLEGTALVCQVT